MQKLDNNKQPILGRKFEILEFFNIIYSSFTVHLFFDKNIIFKVLKTFYSQNLFIAKFTRAF